MTYTEFKRQLGKAGLTVRAFAALLGQTPNSITNYASKGDVPKHLAIIATLMAEMADAGLGFQSLLRRNGLIDGDVAGKPSNA
jgi:hypothetical protein